MSGKQAKRLRRLSRLERLGLPALAFDLRPPDPAHRTCPPNDPRIREGHIYTILSTGDVMFMADMVMEMELGRKLEPNEHVRHINGDKFDNTRGNLWMDVE